MKRFLLISVISGLVLFSGCKDITHVQTGYVADRDDCRSRAESRLSLYNQPDTYPISDKEKNNALLALFNECMREDGWNIGKKDVARAAPPAATPVPTPPPTQPTVIVVQSPAAAPAAAPIIVPAAAAVPASCTIPGAPHATKGIRVHHKGSPPGGTCEAPSDPATTELDKMIQKQ